jgi:hypothetical protein
MSKHDYVLLAALEAGDVIAVPVEFETDRDDYPYRVAHIALEPMTLGDEFGESRRLSPGDILSRSECLASGPALAGMVRRGQVARLPGERGIVGVLRALMDRP